MSKTVVIFGSTMGNTEDMAKAISSVLSAELFNVSKIKTTQLVDYDNIILGSSTWGDGELQDDFLKFEAEMASLDLNSKKAAVFGPGESMYPQFCKAVDILEQRLIKCGAQIACPSLKIDGDVSAQIPAILDWTKNLAAKLK